MISWAEWIRRRRDRQYARQLAAAEAAFKDQWHSFDRHPWRHPWLTPENLSAMREFSRSTRQKVSRVAARHRRSQVRFAFVCNMANDMYSAAVAMRPTGAPITVFPHPEDDYVMSQPEWEEFDGSLNSHTTSFREAQRAGVEWPTVTGVEREAALNHDWSERDAMPDFVTLADHAWYAPYHAFLPLITRLREFDTLFAVQAPYFAYLSHRPYMVTHMGGEIWYECSRDDRLGHLQRAAFQHAQVVIASNPWSYAFARRYGLRNMIYVPTLLDPGVYSPGPPELRAEWQARSGGRFFILSTARVDDFYKGSDIGLLAVRGFLHRHPEARLVQIAWGSDLEKHQQQINEFGLQGQVLFLPPAGKRRLIRYLRSAHVLLDQFRLGYYGMTALEAMATALPTIMRLNVEQYEAFSDAGAPPVCEAGDVATIDAQLEKLCVEPAEAARVGERQRAWFMRYSGAAEWPDFYRDLLTAIGAGYRISYSRSPLRARLTDAERAYHADELAAAPPFPNYL
jgi:glycosyltransferase involved in cell wall biosynthesis